MSYLASKSFWVQVAERAVKTAAYSAGGLLVVATGGLLSVGWLPLLSTVGLVTLVSVLGSLASGAVGPEDTPSLVPTEPV